MQYGGDWDGSNLHMDHIEFLRNTRRLPSADQVRVRLAPAKEITPEPEEGERVVFRSHFLRGIGLPASAFFRSFLSNAAGRRLPTAPASRRASQTLAPIQIRSGQPEVDFSPLLIFL